MGHLTLPFLHVIAAALNFAMILVTSRPFFSIPFKSLKEVLETRETLAAMHLQPKKRSEEHTSELQSRPHLVCRLLLEKKKSPPQPLRVFCPGRLIMPAPHWKFSRFAYPISG